MNIWKFSSEKWKLYRNELEILELRNIISEMKNLLGELRKQKAEGNISNLEDRSIEIFMEAWALSWNIVGQI